MNALNGEFVEIFTIKTVQPGDDIDALRSRALFSVVANAEKESHGSFANPYHFSDLRHGWVLADYFPTYKLGKPAPGQTPVHPEVNKR